MIIFRFSFLSSYCWIVLEPYFKWLKYISKKGLDYFLQCLVTIWYFLKYHTLYSSSGYSLLNEINIRMNLKKSSFKLENDLYFFVVGNFKTSELSCSSLEFHKSDAHLILSITLMNFWLYHWVLVIFSDLNVL